MRPAPCLTDTPPVVGTFAGLGPLRQQIKASKRDSEAGGLNSCGLRGTSPQLAAELSDAPQGGAVLILYPNKGHQERHQGAEEDTQQRAPSSEDTAARVTPQRPSSHDDSGVNPPSCGGGGWTSPHACVHPSRGRRRSSQWSKHTISMTKPRGHQHKQIRSSQPTFSLRFGGKAPVRFKS